MTEPLKKKRVVFLLLPQLQLLDLAGPAQVFSTAADLGANYELVFCASQPSVVSRQGLVVAQLTTLPRLQSDDYVVVPGMSLDRLNLDEPLLDEATNLWLYQAHQAGVQITSVCTAAFALAEAGLLNNRRCTTHWLRIKLLQKKCPSARVLDNVLYVNDHLVTTSAGVASGIDMALAMIERAHGPLFAARIAHYLVVYLRRNGMQSQQSIYLEYRSHLNTGVHRAQDFIINHMTERIKLDQIAEAARLSSRSLNRAFKATLGLTPVQYQQYLRLELAKTLIGNKELGLEEVAAKCGFEDARHFRRLWKAHYGKPPSDMRNKVDDSLLTA